jgi:hypothetical protein
MSVFVAGASQISAASPAFADRNFMAGIAARFFGLCRQSACSRNGVA